MDSIVVRSRLRALVGVLALLLSLVALGSSPHQGSAQDSSVSIVDFAFDPATITVEAGSTVTWTNDGAAPHTVTATGGAFDSGNLAPGASFSFTFDTPGTYGYMCGIHPQMTGTVVVTEAAGDGETPTDEGDTTTGDGTDSTTGDSTDLPTTGVGTVERHGDQALLLAVAALALAGFAVIRRRLV